MWNKILHISSKATKQWKSVLLLYSIQLILGIVVAIIAYIQFGGAIGSSLELNRLSKGFDRSIFSDMINEFPVIITQILNRFGWTVILFLLLSTFLHAGLLGNIRKKQYCISSFFINAKKFYFKLLVVVLISLIKMIVTVAIIWVPFFKWLGNPLETFHSEKTLMLTILGLVMLNVLLIVVIWLWSVLSRYQIIDGNRIVVSMKNGWRDLKNNFWHYYLIGLALLILHVLVTWLYTLIVNDWGAGTWFCVLGLVFIQQIFSIIRIWIRSLGFTAVDNV